MLLFENDPKNLLFLCFEMEKHQKHRGFCILLIENDPKTSSFFRF